MSNKRQRNRRRQYARNAIDWAKVFRKPTALFQLGKGSIYLTGKTREPIYLGECSRVVLTLDKVSIAANTTAVV